MQVLSRVAQGRMVHQTLLSIITEANIQANLTADFLRYYNIVPAPASGSSSALTQPRLTFESQRLITHPWAAFQLHLGAVLRLRQWQLAGLCFPGLPDAVTVWQHTLDHLANTPNVAIPSDFSMQVFKSAYQFLGHTGRHHLGVDVAITPTPNSVILETLADMLWQHRHLTNQN